jgi:hypothetical protein
MRSLNWEEYFYYKDGFLFWKETINNRSRKGKKAGHLHSSGYMHVQVDKKTYKVHRIIYEIFNGPIPEGYVIDHIDRNKNNNIIENLRLATISQNLFNTSKTIKNSTGYKGVRYSSHYEGYYAQIMVNGKQKHLGVFKTPEEAAKQLQGEFYCITS